MDNQFGYSDTGKGIVSGVVSGVFKLALRGFAEHDLQYFESHSAFRTDWVLAECQSLRSSSSLA